MVFILATITLWPTGDSSPLEWVAFPGPTHYTCIDLDTDSDDIRVGNADDNDIDQFSFGSTGSVLLITDITVTIWAYNSSGGVIDPSIDVYLGGWLGAKLYDVQIQPGSEVSQTWSNLSGTQADLDGLEVRCIAPVIGKNQWCRISLLKVIVTYFLITREISGSITELNPKTGLMAGLNIKEASIAELNIKAGSIIEYVKKEDGAVEPAIKRGSIVYTTPKGGIYYGTENFEDEDVGTVPSNWIDESTGTSTALIIDNIYNHKKVLELDDKLASDFAAIRYVFGDQTNETIEWYFCWSGAGIPAISILNSGAQVCLYMGFFSGYLYLWNGVGGYINALAPANEFIHIRIDFRTNDFDYFFNFNQIGTSLPYVAAGPLNYIRCHSWQENNAHIMKWHIDSLGITSDSNYQTHKNRSCEIEVGKIAGTIEELNIKEGLIIAQNLKVSSIIELNKKNGNVNELNKKEGSIVDLNNKEGVIA